ncbi:succinate dehydrogenase/fumarate reductase iron-sulfur subunit [Methanocella sp. CWC-04]|uniref:Succinate dehydrogenase/fumarate reductase iron-sulfur subunit n=1 Tax=Methanooceanicella nereidis TaxID=2052831 RepID=A0AAP2R9F6_9EURY|nr:heterodisulfide reductase-related iron-sulfur binding cluster [Methanocella sp. CWC-04]MCD1293401.1 succinate dehydrogenase/fumarate reductase iron-sulfur subunit [Methanocella sp. CWC-04]
MSDQCVKCGICETVCPSCLSSLRALDLDRSKMISREVLNCTTCNLCVSLCPRGVAITKAIENVRKNIITKGYQETLDYISTYECSIVPSSIPEVKPHKSKVAYYAGCLTTYRQRQIADAVCYTMGHMGIDFTRIPEVCCGSPLNRIGRFDLARNTLEKNLKELRKWGVETVITSCPGCTSTFLEYQDEFEVVHYLDLYDEYDIYNGLKKSDIVATLQYPCHLYRNVSPYTMVIAEKLLDRMYEYVRVSSPESCCGAGGGVRRNDLGLSRNLRAKKVGEIRSLKPDIVATACPQCNFHLSEDISGVIDVCVLVARNLGYDG